MRLYQFLWYIAAKTKIAPLKGISFSRLELMGAQIGSALVQSVASVLSIGERQRLISFESVLLFTFQAITNKPYP